MISVVMQCFGWMPPILSIVCGAVVIVFVLVCLGHAIRALIDILRAVLDIFGGMFGRVVDLFR